MTLPRRELLALAKTFDSDKHDLTGWLVSEKLDGTRAFWDGGVSRGLPTDTIPWSSLINPRTGECKPKIKPVATGLWSRYGNPIIVPDWFLNQLPCCPLDGELWAGRKNFQLCRSICAGDQPDTRFKQMQFAVFDSPPLAALFRDGEIKNANFHRKLYATEIKKWFRSVARDNPMMADYKSLTNENMPYHERLQWLQEMMPEEGRIYVIQHQLLSDNWADEVEVELEDVLRLGGEGLVFHDPNGLWEPKRLASILKYKPFLDAEAQVVGIVAGRTGRIGQTLGKIGALICEARIRPSREYVKFEIGSGLSMGERELGTDLGKWATDHPGQEIPLWDVMGDDWDGKINDTFHTSTRVTFKYRELSNDGIPKEPRFWRVYND
jgi:ATP dependent DNA ligase domain